MQYPPAQGQGRYSPIDASAARMLSALAHGAIAFGLLGIGLLVSLAISGIIWLYGRRSPQVRFQSEQAGCYQCSVLLVNVLFVLVLGVFGGLAIYNALTGQGDWNAGGWIGAGLILFAIWFVGSILYGLFAALMVLLGREFKYPLIGDWISRRM